MATSLSWCGVWTRNGPPPERGRAVDACSLQASIAAQALVGTSAPTGYAYESLGQLVVLPRVSRSLNLRHVLALVGIPIIQPTGGTRRIGVIQSPRRIGVVHRPVPRRALHLASESGSSSRHDHQRCKNCNYEQPSHLPPSVTLVRWLPTTGESYARNARPVSERGFAHRRRPSRRADRVGVTIRVLEDAGLDSHGEIVQRSDLDGGAVRQPGSTSLLSTAQPIEAARRSAVCSVSERVGYHPGSGDLRYLVFGLFWCQGLSKPATQRVRTVVRSPASIPRR